MGSIYSTLCLSCVSSSVGYLHHKTKIYLVWFFNNSKSVTIVRDMKLNPKPLEVLSEQGWLEFKNLKSRKWDKELFEISLL